MTKTLVIGLDAATWRVMKPLMQEERLPNIQRLIHEGTSGILYSTIPPFTPSAWTSIVTGVNPGKHGFFDFVAQDHETYRVEYVNYSRLNRPAIWHIFNAYGKKVGVVNFPMAFPPPHVDSFFISGFPTPENKNYAYPRQLNTFLHRRKYRIYPCRQLRDGKEKYFYALKDLVDIRCNVAIELMKRYDWELFWVVFQALDWIQHYFWNEIIDGEDAIADFYCHIDHIIGHFLQEISDKWNVVILSDHGFHKIEGEIHINNLLEKWGYLTRVEPSHSLPRGAKHSLFKPGFALWNTLSPHIRRNIGNRIPASIVAYLRELKHKSSRRHPLIDWRKTQAFSFGYMGRIYIHTKEEYPHGTVSAVDEYARLRKEIIGKLQSLKNPETGGSIVGKVFRKEEVYSGDQLHHAPDIVFIPSDYEYMFYGDFGADWYNIPRNRLADHDMEGIIIMRGKDIRQGHSIKAETVDIVPTLLYVHDVPLLPDMDGRVLQEALGEELVSRREIRTAKNVLHKNDVDEFLDEDEQQKVAERLRDMGYL